MSNDSRGLNRTGEVGCHEREEDGGLGHLEQGRQDGGGWVERSSRDRIREGRVEAISLALQAAGSGSLDIRYQMTTISTSRTQGRIHSGAGSMSYGQLPS